MVTEVTDQRSTTQRTTNGGQPKKMQQTQEQKKKKKKKRQDPNTTQVHTALNSLCSPTVNLVHKLLAQSEHILRTQRNTSGATR